MSRRVIVVAALVGVIGLVGFLVALFVSPERALLGYLVAFGFGVTVALGALAFVMIAHVSGARWFVPLRRPVEAIASTLPLFVVLFVPIAIGLSALYPFARPSSHLSEAVIALIARRRAYANEPFFLARAGAYLVFWALLATALSHLSRAHDRHPATTLHARMRAVSAVAMPPFAFTLTFAAFDWFMSLDPEWTSTAFGLYVFAGGFAAGVALATSLTAGLRRAAVLPAPVGESHLHAEGRVLLAAVSLWAYLAFVQYLIVWLGNLPDEISFYLVRTREPWLGVTIALAIVHFAVPFLALVQRAVTRRGGRLAVVALVVLAAHYVDLYWIVVPSRSPARANPNWADLASLLCVCGFATAFGAWRFATAAPVPSSDPDLASGLAYEST